MITTVKRPYEFLVRWRNGVISGAHVGFELTTIEDGKMLSTTPLNVMPVDVGQGQGFPLAEILSQIHIDAIAGMDAAKEAQSAAESVLALTQSNLEKVSAKLTTAETNLDMANAKVAKLEAAAQKDTV